MLQLPVELLSRGFSPWRAEFGLSELYSQRQRADRICASGAVVNSSVLRNSSRKRPLKDSANPFSHGDPGEIEAVLVVGLASHQSRRA